MSSAGAPCALPVSITAEMLRYHSQNRQRVRVEALTPSLQAGLHSPFATIYHQVRKEKDLGD